MNTEEHPSKLKMNAKANANATGYFEGVIFDHATKGDQTGKKSDQTPLASLLFAAPWMSQNVLWQLTPKRKTHPRKSTQNKNAHLNFWTNSAGFLFRKSSCKRGLFFGGGGYVWIWGGGFGLYRCRCKLEHPLISQYSSMIIWPLSMSSSVMMQTECSPLAEEPGSPPMTSLMMSWCGSSKVIQEPCS